MYVVVVVVVGLEEGIRPCCVVWCGVVFVCVAVLRGEGGEGKGREEMDGARFMINKSSMESIADVIASQLCWMMDG